MKAMGDLFVRPAAPGASRGILSVGARRFVCALGRSGISAAKLETDGATPAGIFPLRRVFWRADRLMQPQTLLPVRAIAPEDGWCDDPGSADYNRLVRLPHPDRHEKLWREDAVYDLIVELGYNDAPVVAGLGSAIFLHVARPGYTPTEGCVALALGDLLDVLRLVGVGSTLAVEEMPAGN